MSYACKTYYCNYESLNISISNIYYNDNIDLNVSAIYTKDNFEKNAKDAISEEANQTKAINARQAAIDAGAKWEDELNAF